MKRIKTLLISQKYLKEIVTQGMKKASIIPLKLHFEKAKENKQVLLLFLRMILTTPTCFA